MSRLRDLWLVTWLVIGMLLATLFGCATPAPVVTKVPEPPVIIVPEKPVLKGLSETEVVRAVRLYILDLETALAQAVKALDAYRQP